MEDEIRAKLADTGSTRDRLPLGQPDRPRRPRDGQRRRRRARSSSSHPRRGPDTTSSRRCSPSPTTPTGAPEPYHIVAEIHDSAEPRGGADGRRRRGRAGARRRPDLAHHRPDLPPVGPVGRLHRAARFRRRRDLLQRRAGARPARRSATRSLAYEDSARDRAALADGDVDAQPADGHGHRGRRPRHRHRRGRRHRPPRRATRRPIDEAAIATAAPAATRARADADPGLEPARRRRSSTSSTTTSPPARRSTSSPTSRRRGGGSTALRRRSRNLKVSVRAGRHHRPALARRPRVARATITSSCSPTPTTLDAAAGRRPDAGHPAPPARHRRTAATTSRSSARCSTSATATSPR